MLSANPIQHSRTKHVELDLYFVREKVQNQSLFVKHIRSADQIADIQQRPCPAQGFKNCEANSE